MEVDSLLLAKNQQYLLGLLGIPPHPVQHRASPMELQVNLGGNLLVLAGEDKELNRLPDTIQHPIDRGRHHRDDDDTEQDGLHALEHEEGGAHDDKVNDQHGAPRGNNGGIVNHQHDNVRTPHYSRSPT